MRDTTRVRFIDSAATDTDTYRRGQEYDVEPAFAAEMIAAGGAVYVTPPEVTPADAEEPKPDRKAAKRRPARAVDSDDASD